MSSGPLPTTPEACAAAVALFKSGAIAPMRPLVSAFAMPNTPRLRVTLSTIEHACDALIDRWARGDATLPHPPIDPRVREAALLDVRSGRRLLFTRMDVVCPPEAPAEFQLLEVQAGDPSAMGWCDLLATALGTPATLMRSHRRHLEALTPGRSVAFAVPLQSIVRSDHEALAVHYRANGWEATVVDPGSLRFNGKVLTAANRPVDVVFRDALDELLDPARSPGGESLLDAHAAGKVLVANPFSAALADDKSWLEALSTESEWGSETWAVLSRHVPCTRVVRAGKVRWRGEEVELPSFIRSNRERLVLKPCEGYGGFGVVVGPASTVEDWEAALGRGLSGQRLVVQEYVSLPRHTLRMLDGSGVEQTGVANVVHSLWVHAGQLAGGFVRASNQPVVNVHQGGGLGPISFAPPV